MSIYIYNMQTPIGTLRLCSDGAAVTAIEYAGGCLPDAQPPSHPLLAEAARQLEEYFTGKRTMFELPLAAKGTGFQHAVWEQLRAIPYGETRTYGQIAAALGKPGAARAVGNACSKNNVLIVIPCHRVCGKGNLGGFALDMRIKETLLKLEKPVVTGFSGLL